MTKKKDSNVVVVGGGIAGIFSALVASESYQHVTLIEKQQELGGLLRSKQYGSDVFDHGTHYVLASGDPDIDSLITDKINESDWEKFDTSLPEGNFFCGRLNTENACRDLRDLPEPVFKNGLLDFFECEIKQNFGNQYDQLRGIYGATFAEHVLIPHVERLTGVSAKELAIDVHRLFGPARLVMLPDDAAVEIKKVPYFDEKIAFTDATHRKSDMLKYYPKNGGVGNWIDCLEKSLNDRGVEILTGCAITSTEIRNKIIREIHLDNSETRSCDLLIWTVPPVLLSKLAGIALNSPQPAMRDLQLVHFVFDAPPVEKLHWVTVYDEGFHSFRVTLYSNRVTPQNNRHKITVEVLTNGEIQGIEDDIEQELRRMHIISDRTQRLWAASDFHPNAFPVLGPNSALDLENQIHELTKELQNVKFFGRGIRGTYHQIPILKNIHENLNNLAGKLV